MSFSLSEYTKIDVGWGLVFFQLTKTKTKTVLGLHPRLTEGVYGRYEYLSSVSAVKERSQVK